MMTEHELNRTRDWLYRLHETRNTDAEKAKVFDDLRGTAIQFEAELRGRMDYERTLLISTATAIYAAMVSRPDALTFIDYRGAVELAKGLIDSVDATFIKGR